jgi:lantibiotic modifying enzyme
LRQRWTDEALTDADSTAAWCKGHSGVAFAAARMLRAVGWPADEIRQAIQPEVTRIIDAPLGDDISICHGVAGRLAMLCWLADDLDWPQLRDEAGALNKQFLERYHDGGWTCGVGATPDLPSFLLGLSGWYFVQMMLADPGLCLPLAFGSR